MIKIKNRCCYTVTLILCGTLFLTGLTGCKSREAQFLIDGLQEAKAEVDAESSEEKTSGQKSKKDTDEKKADTEDRQNDGGNSAEFRKKQAESDLEQANMNLFFSEKDFERIEERQKENVMLYKQAAEVVMTMLKQHLTIGQMDSVGEYMMEHYLRDLLGYYLETMIHENGNYLMGYNRLKNEFHHEDAGQSFHMIKKEDCEIPPEIFRKILFLLMILTKACRQILGKYAVSVTMETASEKFFVVRFSCDYSQNLDKNGQIIYTGENQECHKDIMDLTEKITDSIVYRTVSLEKENRYILNCAIERRNHRVDS